MDARVLVPCAAHPFGNPEHFPSTPLPLPVHSSPTPLPAPSFLLPIKTTHQPPLPPPLLLFVSPTLPPSATHSAAIRSQEGHPGIWYKTIDVPETAWELNATFTDGSAWQSAPGGGAFRIRLDAAARLADQVSGKVVWWTR